jgi:plasmid stability protein
VVVELDTQHGGGHQTLVNRQYSLHNACMPTSITIRDVPDETRDELAARAARSGRSLQEYLRRELIALARKPDMESLLTRVEARKSAAPSTLSASDILRYRDADRR